MTDEPSESIEDHGTDEEFWELQRRRAASLSDEFLRREVELEQRLLSDWARIEAEIDIERRFGGWGALTAAQESTWRPYVLEDVGLYGVLECSVVIREGEFIFNWRSDYRPVFGWCLQTFLTDNLEVPTGLSVRHLAEGLKVAEVFLPPMRKGTHGFPLALEMDAAEAPLSFRLLPIDPPPKIETLRIPSVGGKVSVRISLAAHTGLETPEKVEPIRQDAWPRKVIVDCDNTPVGAVVFDLGFEQERRICGRWESYLDESKIIGVKLAWDSTDSLKDEILFRSEEFGRPIAGESIDLAAAEEFFPDGPLEQSVELQVAVYE